MRTPTWLAGVGATALASSLVFALAYALRAAGVLRFTSRPDFEFIDLPAYALGAAVALATSGGAACSRSASSRRCGY